MSDRMSQAWRDVSSEFSALGGVLQDHYKSAGDESGDVPSRRAPRR